MDITQLQMDITQLQNALDIIGLGSRVRLALQSNDPYLLAVLALNLSSDNEVEVRLWVARNPATLYETLAFLMNDEDVSVANAAKHCRQQRLEADYGV